MFCYQCEQTAKGTGCTIAGVCGKTADVANLQDLLVYKLRELSQLVIQAQKAGLRDEKISVFTAEALFVTLTNVNFDPEAIAAYIRKTAEMHDQLHKQLKVNVDYLPLAPTLEGLVAQGKQHGINADPTIDPDLHSITMATNLWVKRCCCLLLPRLSLGQKRPQSFRLHP